MTRILPSGSGTAVSESLSVLAWIWLHGHTWRSRAALMRGQRLIGISAANRAAAGIAEGVNDRPRPPLRG